MSVVPPDRPYATAPADTARDRRAILALWADGLTQNGVPAEKFDWYYLRNPQGTPLVTFLERDGERVGVASVGPRRVCLGEQELSAGVLVDFVVKTAHRNFFAAVTLQQEVRRRASAMHALLLALPNARSLAVLRRVGHRELGLMERRVRVLRSGGYLSKRLPIWLSRSIAPFADGLLRARRALAGGGLGRFRAEWLPRPDARFDELWRRVRARRVVMGVRDQLFLTWRFVDCPIDPCRFFVLCDRNGGIVAYAACAPRGQALKILDFLADSDPRILPALLGELSRQAYDAGYHSLTVEHFGDESTRATLAAAGLEVRESRPLCASGTALELLLAGAAWHVTCADEDW